MPENQTAWNSDNQEINGKVNQNNQTAGAPRQRNMAQMKEQSKTSERELSDEQIANRYDEESKALVIKMHGTPTTKELKKKLTRTTKLVLKDKEIWPK